MTILSTIGSITPRYSLSSAYDNITNSIYLIGGSGINIEYSDIWILNNLMFPNQPSTLPSSNPTNYPTNYPTINPTFNPTKNPTLKPTIETDDFITAA